MPEEKKRIRIEKRIIKGDKPGQHKVFAFAREGEEIDIETVTDALTDDEFCWVDEEDDEGHSIIKIRIPKMERGDGESDALVRAAGVSGAIETLEGEIGDLVRRARTQGYTWTQIGDAIGTSKQAAWERFSGEE